MKGIKSMANNYNQATISPALPAVLFSQQELQALEAACGLESEEQGDDLYFFAGDFFCEEGEGDDGQAVDCLALLRDKLGQLDETQYPHIVIHGASTCSKMRPGEFGGFVHLITRDRVQSWSTWHWLEEQINSSNPAVPAADNNAPPPVTTGDE
jgi:hypothetical protein